MDWLLTRRSEENALPEVRWAGPFQDTLDVFIPLMTRWLENAPGLVRLALGVVAHEPVQDRIAGYRKLAQYLPAVQVDPERSEDFLYQINRPRKSTVIETLKINRLSRWSSVVVVALRFALSPLPVVHQSADGNHTFRIELDLSTDAELGGELPRAQLPRLLKELESLANELVTRGDIP